MGLVLTNVGRKGVNGRGGIAAMQLQIKQEWRPAVMYSWMQNAVDPLKTEGFRRYDRGTEAQQPSLAPAWEGCGERRGAGTSGDAFLDAGSESEVRRPRIT